LKNLSNLSDNQMKEQFESMANSLFKKIRLGVKSNSQERIDSGKVGRLRSSSGCEVEEKKINIPSDLSKYQKAFSVPPKDKKI
jgi:hypothetical protein